MQAKDALLLDQSRRKPRRCIRQSREQRALKLLGDGREISRTLLSRTNESERQRGALPLRSPSLLLFECPRGHTRNLTEFDQSCGGSPNRRMRSISFGYDNPSCRAAEANSSISAISGLGFASRKYSRFWSSSRKSMRA